MTRGADSCPWRVVDGVVVLRVRLTPKAGKDAVDGAQNTADGPAVRMRVRAVPEDGQANRALELLVAEWLDMPKSSVAVASGAKSRIKSVTLAGNAARISALLADNIKAL